MKKYRDDTERNIRVCWAINNSSNVVSREYSVVNSKFEKQVEEYTRYFLSLFDKINEEEKAKDKDVDVKKSKDVGKDAAEHEALDLL